MATNSKNLCPLSTLCAICIAILSLAPIGAPEIAHDVPLADKWAHFVMYATLTLIIWMERRYRCGTSSGGMRLAVWGMLFPIMLGGMMELCQAYLTTYRSGEWMDFLANSIGVLLGCIIGYIIRKITYNHT